MMVEISDLRLSEEDKRDIARMTAEMIGVKREPTRTMSKQEAIEYLPGVSRESFEEICRVHKIGVKIGPRWHYTNTELDKLLEEHQGRVLV